MHKGPSMNGNADCQEIIGNEIDRVVVWKGKSNLESLAGKPVRLRFQLKDADVYALQFVKTPLMTSFTLSLSN